MKYKVRVNSKNESIEAQDLGKILGYSRPDYEVKDKAIHEGYVCLGFENDDKSVDKLILLVNGFNSVDEDSIRDYVELSLAELRSMVKSKEYLTKNKEGGYSLVNHRFGDEDIEVPEGADCYVGYNGDRQNWKTFHFGRIKNGRVNEIYKNGNEGSYHNSVDELIERGQMIWQRNPVDIDKIAYERGSFPSVDNVNHPSHYASGAIECIDAIESSMTKEAFAGYLKGNVQKYMWRYENKGGVESLQKAQWYLSKLILLQSA